MEMMAVPEILMEATGRLVVRKLIAFITIIMKNGNRKRMNPAKKLKKSWGVPIIVIIPRWMAG